MRRVRVRVLWGIRRQPNTFNKPISSNLDRNPPVPILAHLLLTAGNLIGVKCGRTYSQGVFRLGHCYYLSVIGADLYSGGAVLSPLLIARRVTHAAYQQTTDGGGEPPRTERTKLSFAFAACARKLKGLFFPIGCAHKILTEILMTRVLSLCFRMLLKSASLILLVCLLIKSTAARIGEFDAAMHFDLFVSSAFLMLIAFVWLGLRGLSAQRRSSLSALVAVLWVHKCWFERAGIVHELGICSQLNANCVCGKTLQWKDLAFQRVANFCSQGFLLVEKWGYAF